MFFLIKDLYKQYLKHPKIDMNGNILHIRLKEVINRLEYRLWNVYNMNESTLNYSRWIDKLKEYM